MAKKKTIHQPLFQSKLNPPISSRVLVSRTRLLEKLQSSRQTKLTLLCGPPGFGKTTLMVQWLFCLQEQGTPTAWLTLDEADNDPGRFLTYFIAAAQKNNPHFGLVGSELGQITAEHTPTGLLLYVLDLLSTFKAPLNFFLDDFGVLQSPEALNIVQQLLNNLPSDKHLIIALRQFPELRLERIRAQGELLEIDFKDLQFSREETEQFIRQTQGLDLNESDIEYLYDITEGWAAGLQLSTLSSAWKKNQENNFRTHSWDTGRIFNYFAEEVLACQPIEIQSFLLKTSILKRLTGPLCNKLTGRSDGYETLDYLEKANIFLVPLDAEHRWYRYHGLFANFLLARLKRKEDQRIIALHRAACEWYSEVGEIQEAAEQAILAGDVEYAANQMEGCAFDLVNQGLTATLVEWGEMLPEPVINRHPVLELAYIYALIVRHQPDKALKVLDHLGQNGGLSNMESHILHDLYNLRVLALFVQDKIKECEQITMEALANLDFSKQDRQLKFLQTLFHIAGSLKMTVGRFEEALGFVWQAAQLIGRTPGAILLINVFLEQAIWFAQGKLNEVLAITRSSLADIGSSPSRYSGGGMAIAVLQSEILYEKNELAQAENLLLTYHPLLKIAIPDVMIKGLRTLSRIRLAYGDLTGAVRYLTQLERLGTERDILRVSASARQERIRIALQRGNLDLAIQIYRQHDDRSIWLSFEGHCMIGNDPETPVVTQIRLMIGRGQHRKAMDLLKNELKKAEDLGFFRQGILLRILMAKALDTYEEKRQAHRVLREALLLAQGEGFIRSFVDEGDPIPKMIREVQKFAVSSGMMGQESISVEYLDRILRGIGEVTPLPIGLKGDQESAPPEPLTSREIDILEKVSMGLTNKNLADQLCISVHTVRFHLRNIHWKLGAHNRTQAVALARSFGYIR
jgi:LuxR family maltose regulon positive regulatory protein